MDGPERKRAGDAWSLGPSRQATRSRRSMRAIRRTCPPLRPSPPAVRPRAVPSGSPGRSPRTCRVAMLSRPCSWSRCAARAWTGSRRVARSSPRYRALPAWRRRAPPRGGSARRKPAVPVRADRLPDQAQRLAECLDACDVLMAAAFVTAGVHEVDFEVVDAPAAHGRQDLAEVVRGARMGNVERCAVLTADVGRHPAARTAGPG